MTRMTRFLAGLAIMLLAAFPASAHFVDGYLAQCSAVTTTSCTEIALTGYARQAMFFNPPSLGRAVTGLPYRFGTPVGTAIAGRAVYDAPTGGNLLMVIPLASSLTITAPGDQADVGALPLTFSALSTYQLPDVFSGAFAPGTVLGTTGDGSNFTAGTTVSITRGMFSVTPTMTDPSYRQVSNTTGFSYQVPNAVSTLDLQGAGTLAAGTVLLPLAPQDGAVLSLFCSVTITALTITPGAGTTMTGTAPTTCGANASHELRFFKGNNTWHVAF